MDPMTNSAIPSIDVNELPDDAPLLDVRENEEWNAGHAPAATHIALGELPNRLGDVSKEEPLYVVCRSGGRSARAVAYLRETGFDAVNVEGGMQAWGATGKEMVAEGAGAPAVI